MDLHMLDIPRLRGILAAGLLATVLVATGTAGSPAAAQDRTLVLAMSVTPKGTDSDIWLPGQIETTSNVYEGLVKFAVRKDADGRSRLDTSKVEPHLAESWTVSADGKEYVFKLREKVLSHFGNELTAEDIVWTFQKSELQKRQGLFIKNVARITAIEAVSRYQVKFALSEPNRIFLSILTTPFPAIFDSVEAKKHATPDDPFATRWLGTNTAAFGPWHLESNQAGQMAVFVPNRNYAFAKPFYDRVVWREVPSPANRVALVKSGQVHYAEQIPLQQIVDLRRDKAVKVESEAGIGSATVRMNPKYPPFDNQKVRQAVAYATDYAAIGEAVFLGLGPRSRGLLSAAMPGYVEAYRYETDLERAKLLLTEAGFPNGLDVTLEYSNNWWWEEGLALQMQAGLAKAGIRVTPKRIPATEINTRRALTAQTLPFFTHLTAPFVPDPSYAMFLTAHSKGNSNANGNNSPELDRLIDLGISERDDAKWLDLVAQAQRAQADYATFIETNMPGTHEVFASCIDGYIWKPHGRLIWKDLTCTR